MLTTEVSTVYEQDRKIRKIHHILHAPSFDVVDQINESLSKHGDLKVDGRPTFNNLTSPELVEIIMGISKDVMITPAHAWTSWFSIFGSKSGFNSMEECYQDQSKHIFSLETGLSSNPLMNFRVSKLDKYTLLSNSDCHSPYPNRIGRECNVFDLKELNYWKILDSIKKKDPTRFLFTIEFFPEEGKYHYTGHRKCGISLHPKQAIKLNNICPICKRKLTVGVLQRVEELADREEGLIPKNSIPFKSSIPLMELITLGLGISQVNSSTGWKEYNKLIENFGNEFNILLNVSRENLEKVSDKRLVDLIMLNREGKIKINPGYDGVYGEPIFEEQEEIKKPEQKRLLDF